METMRGTSFHRLFFGFGLLFGEVSSASSRGRLLGKTRRPPKLVMPNNTSPTWDPESKQYFACESKESIQYPSKDTGINDLEYLDNAEIDGGMMSSGNTVSKDGKYFRKSFNMKSGEPWPKEFEIWFGCKGDVAPGLYWQIEEAGNKFAKSMLVPPVSYDDTNWYLYFKMGGRSVAQIKKAPGTVTPDPEQVLFHLLAGVVFLRDLGFAHNDIHPGNVLLGEATADVKIIDFGLAAYNADKGKSKAWFLNALENGAPLYRGKVEQCGFANVPGYCSEQKDIRMVAGIIWELITGDTLPVSDPRETWVNGVFIRTHVVKYPTIYPTIVAMLGYCKSDCNCQNSHCSPTTGECENRFRDTAAQYLELLCTETENAIKYPEICYDRNPCRRIRRLGNDSKDDQNCPIDGIVWAIIACVVLVIGIVVAVFIWRRRRTSPESEQECRIAFELSCGDPTEARRQMERGEFSESELLRNLFLPKSELKLLTAEYVSSIGPEL